MGVNVKEEELQKAIQQMMNAFADQNISFEVPYVFKDISFFQGNEPIPNLETIEPEADIENSVNGSASKFIL